MMQINQQSVVTSRDLFANNQNKARVIKIVCLPGQSRFIAIQEDGAVSVLRLLYTQKLCVNLVYSGHPLGFFRASNALLSPNGELLVVYGHTSMPLILQLKN